MDVSDIFYFLLCAGAGKKEEASEEVAGGSVLIKNRGVRCSKLEPFCDTEKWAHLANLG